MKKLVLGFLLLGSTLACTSQTPGVRMCGYYYTTNGWSYVLANNQLMVKDELNKDSSISKITMQLPVKSQLHKAHLPVPAHKTFTFISPTLDSCAYNGPKEYWKLGSVLVQKVRLKKDLVHVEGNAYSHEWVIAGKGKSSRRLVWYLSPEPRYP